MRKLMLAGWVVLAFGAGPAAAAPGPAHELKLAQAAAMYSPTTEARCYLRKWCGPVKCHRRLWCR
jgi:hypothetical protein